MVSGTDSDHDKAIFIPKTPEGNSLGKVDALESTLVRCHLLGQQEPAQYFRHNEGANKTNTAKNSNRPSSMSRLRNPFAGRPNSE